MFYLKNLTIFALAFLISNHSSAEISCLPNGSGKNEVMSSFSKLFNELNNSDFDTFKALTVGLDDKIFDKNEELNHENIYDFVSSLKTDTLLKNIKNRCDLELDTPLIPIKDKFCFINSALLQLKVITIDWDHPQNTSSTKIPLCPSKSFETDFPYTSAAVRG